MNNVIHVEVEIIKLLAVGVWLGDVNGDLLIVDDIGLILDDRGYDFGIFGAQPSKVRGDTFGVGLAGGV